jgi:hypothetical protein
VLINMNAGITVVGLAGPRATPAFIHPGDSKLMPIQRSWQRDLRDAEYAKQNPPVRKPEPVDLKTFVTQVLNGEVGGVRIESMLTVDGACAAVIGQLERRGGRRLTQGERTQVEIVTVCSINMGKLESAAYLEDAQRMFHSPAGMLG